MTETPPYEFGEIRVDLRRMIVSRAGEPVALEPKTFDVLRYLIEHRDRLVTKEELLDAVWKDTFVTPNVLTRAVAQLRRGLGDDAYESRYIETLPKRGYRFIAEIAVAAPNAAVEPEPPALPPTGPTAMLSTPTPTPTPVPVPRSRRVPWSIAAAALLVVVGAAYWLGRDHTRSSTAAAPPILTRLTVRSGQNTSPHLSPDGRAVAFSSDRTGSLEIYVVGLASGSREIQITNDQGQNQEPEWSPDGQWLVYHSQAHDGIWMVPSTGGTTRQVAEFGSEPSWSPDGQRIVFSSDTGGFASQSVLWTIARDGSDRRQLTKLGEPAGGHRQPSWSHDGKTVVFAVFAGSDGFTVWAVPVADGHPRRLGASRRGGYPRFAPDDRSVMWAGESQLWNLPVVPGTVEPRGNPTAVVALGDGLPAGFSTALDGMAVVGLVTGDANLWAVDITANGAAAEPVRLTDDAVRNTVPAYSPGGQVAYTQLVSGRPNSVWLMNEDGSARELLLSESSGMEASWARDPTRVLIASRDPVSSLRWLDTRTRATMPVNLADREIRSARVSPDGQEIAFHVIEPNGVMNVFIQRLDGSARRRLTSDSEAVSYPIWSPDGRSLAVEIKRGDQTHVGLVSRDGGPVQQLTNERGQSWPNTWSPDGQWIGFAGERDGVWNVWAVSPQHGKTRALTRFRSASGYVRWPTWSPRGNRIVFERNMKEGAVWMVKLQHLDPSE